MRPILPSKSWQLNQDKLPELTKWVIVADREWIKQNIDEYRGRWVALKNGKLLASGNDLDELYFGQV